MNEKIEILHVEDDSNDAELIKSVLEDEGLAVNITLVKSREQYIDALQSKAFDLIISDYTMSGFTGNQALDIAKEVIPATPFIFVSGTIGEDAAIESLLIGATDYVLKTKLSRLIPAVQRALKDARNRKSLVAAENALKESENRFRRLAENAPDIIFRYRIGHNKGFEYISPACTVLFGYTPEEFYADPDLYYNILHPDDRFVIDERDPHFQYIKSLEVRWIRKDQTLIWTEHRLVPIYDGGLIIGVEGIIRDITDRKLSEERLRSSEERYRTLFESLDEGFAVIEVMNDANGKTIDYRFLEVNPAFEKQTGLPVNPLGKRIREIVPDHEEYWFELYGTVARTGTPVRFENQAFVSRKNYEVFAFCIGPRESKKVGVLFKDITEKRAAAEALKETEKKLRMVINHAPISIFATDAQGVFTLHEGKGMERVGMKPGDNVGVSGFELFGDIEFAQRNGTVINGREVLHRVLSGETISGRTTLNGVVFDNVLTPISDERGKINGSVAVAYDVTERKLAEDALKESEERFKLLFEYAPDAYYLNNLHGVFVAGNKATEQLTGYKREELIGGSFLTLQLLTPESLSKAASLLEKSVFGQPTGPDELLLIRKDGAAVPFETRTFPVNINGETLVLGIARDISERKKAEKALVESEERFRSIYELSPIGIANVGIDGTFIRVNNAAQKIFGYSEEELNSFHFNDITYAEDKEIGKKEFQELVKKNKNIVEFEKRYLHKNGTPVWVHLIISAVRDVNQELLYTVTMIENINEKKLAEEKQRDLERQLLHSKKMESIGTLAGGIAHDFNNILGIMLAHVSFLPQLVYDREKHAKSVDVITKSIHRGANLVKQLLTFARKTEITIEEVRITEVIDELLSLLNETFPKIISIDVSIGENIPLVKADKTQLHQILINLCVNARDALMPNGGRLSIHASYMDGKEARRLSEKAASASYVELSVADTGIGMDKQIQTRIFEPFFTTKELGKGTGLGLSTVYGIVEQHKGFILTDSDLGKGTTFRIFIPVESEKKSTSQPAAALPADLPGGTETILLVEDEKLLHDMIRTVLEVKGYTVYSAFSGTQGVEVFTAHSEKIDLVITDLGLPEMSGDVMSVKMKIIDPQARIIVASGYFEPNTLSQILSSGVNEVIQKPYNTSELLMKIRNVLK